MIVLCLGFIITTVGKFMAIGVDQGGTAYRVFDTVSLCFIMLLLIVFAVFEQDFSKDERNQSQVEPDSSLF